MTELPQLPEDDLACSEEVELITDFLEDALEPEVRERLERHLETCPGCTEYLTQMRTLAGGLGDLREDALPARAHEELLAAFRQFRSQ